MTGTSEAMIEAQGLTKTFGQRTAVDNVSFSVNKGEIMGFLGPNAAGKTTTMKMLTCYYPPNSGRAVVNGYDILEDSAGVRRSIGFMPENVPLYNEMTVREYLTFVVKAKGVPHEDRPKAIKKALDRCSLEVVADRLIGNISRGYRQRVGLAQAIVNDPPVLILDEPSVGLDPEQIKNFRDLILSFVGSSTVLLSTHILSEVSKTCQRVCIIDHGKILAVDTPDNLENRTRNGIRLRMQILAPRADEVFESLKSIKGFSGLRNTSFAKLEGSDWPLLTFEANVGFQDNLSARRDLCDMLAQKHWNLYGLADEHTSLEDAFITLVRDHEAELADEADASQEASAESRAVDEQTNKKTDADGDSSKGQIEQGNLTDPPVSDPQAATKSAGESQKGGAK
ncbi:MAG: ABC transporter ATP-binding protein [bacterium]|nr:ABC transporter ATP-binding protein [bacterium]